MKLHQPKGYEALAESFFAETGHSSDRYGLNLFKPFYKWLYSRNRDFAELSDLKKMSKGLTAAKAQRRELAKRNSNQS